MTNEELQEYDSLSALDWFLYELGTIEYDYFLDPTLVKRLTFMANTLYRGAKEEANEGTN